LQYWFTQEIVQESVESSDNIKFISQN